jgi:arylsulfatase A-like enzyme
MANFDLLPTFLKLAGGQLPGQRKLDGVDLWPLLSGRRHAQVHRAFYYFNGAKLEAVRSGPWKLALPGQGGGGSARKVPSETPSGAARLYNLDRDIGESTDVARQHPRVLRRLEHLLAEMDADLGRDKAGRGVRPPGRVARPQPLLLPGTPFVMDDASPSPTP